MREQLREAASRALVASGITRIGRTLGDKSGALILYGHRISADDEGYLQGLAPHWFAEQVRYLARHYEIITLDALITCLERGKAPPPKSVVLTLDDGFRDNIEAGLPILDALGARATVFVVTQSLSDGRLPWSQRLGYAFQHTTATELRHPLLGPEPVPITDGGTRRRTYQTIKLGLSSESREHRDDHIERLAHELGVDLPNDRMMTWDHASAVLDRGHAIGAHTYSHALLARLPLALAREEMLRSRDDLASHLGIVHPPFCFPAGSTSPALFDLARTLGFRSAFLPNRLKRLNRPQDVDAFSMVRVGLPNAPAHQLEAELDGPLHAMRRWLGRYPRNGKSW